MEISGGIKFLQRWSLACMLLAVSHNIAANDSVTANFDIAGVKFGMTPDQVRSALKAHDPSMDVKDYSTWRERAGVAASLASIYGCGGGGQRDGNERGCGENIVVYFGQVSRVVVRIKRDFRSGGKLTQENVSSAILKKYGVPFYEYQNDSGMFGGKYLYDSSGAKLSDNRLGCDTPADNVIPNIRCGLFVQIQAFPGMDKKLSERFIIRAQDSARLIQDYEKTEDMNKAAVNAATKSQRDKAAATGGPKM